MLSGGAYVPLSRKHHTWVHLYCILWTPGAFFERHNLLDGPNIRDVHSSRFHIKCALCKRGGPFQKKFDKRGMSKTANVVSTKFEGACIQCSHKGCHYYAHVSCARTKQLYMAMKEDEVMGFPKVELFCEKHTPQHLEYDPIKHIWKHTMGTLELSASYLELCSIRSDLDAMRTLSDLVRKREKIKLRLSQGVQNTFERERCKFEMEGGPTARKTRRQEEEEKTRRERRANGILSEEDADDANDANDANDADDVKEESIESNSGSSTADGGDGKGSRKRAKTKQAERGKLEVTKTKSGKRKKIKNGASSSSSSSSLLPSEPPSKKKRANGKSSSSSSSSSSSQSFSLGPLPVWAVTMPNQWNDPIYGILDIDTEMRASNDPVLKHPLLPLLDPALNTVLKPVPVTAVIEPDKEPKSKMTTALVMKKINKDKLPKGWKAIVNTRDSGSMYTSYIGPKNQRCRSLVELAKLLGITKMTELQKKKSKEAKKKEKEKEKERKKKEKERIKREKKEAKLAKKAKKNAPKIPPLVGRGLGRTLQVEVTDALVHTRSLDDDLNFIDYRLMEVFNAVDTCSVMWTDGSEHNCASAFQSVPTSLEAKGYHTVVRHPIGLRNVHTKIQRGGYEDVASLAKDIRRMIHNAKLYNFPGSMIHSDATRLSQALQTITSKQKQSDIRAQKQSSVRRRQARNASPEQHERKSMPSSSSSSSSSSSLPACCELCRKYNRPELPGDGCPIGSWYCGDCRANPTNATSSTIIGRSVRVWWPSDHEYYLGSVLAYDANSGYHRVYYDVDHDWEFLDLSTQEMVFLQ